MLLQDALSRWMSAVLVLAMVLGPIPMTAFASERASVQITEGEGQRWLKAGIQLYEEMEWDQAVTQLQQALDQLRVEQDRAGQVQAHWYLTLILRAQGKTDDARSHLVELLRLDPTFKLPETLQGTDFETLFQEAVAQVDQTPPVIHLLPTREVSRSGPIRVVVEVQDESPIKRLEVTYQRPGESAIPLRDLRQESDRRWVIQIPAQAAEGVDTLIIQITAQDVWQNTQTLTEPLRLPKKKGGHGVLYLVGGAIVAIGGGVAALLLAGGTPEEAGPTSPGPKDTTPPPSDEAAWPQSEPPSPPQ